MCFYNDDADWYASICDVTEGPADQATHCDECGATIAIGDLRKHVFMQEHEECVRCEIEDAEEPCETHCYGETFECDICETCLKILRAIDAVETDEGCPANARQPMFGALRDAILEDDCRYAARAIQMFPELASVGWLVPSAERQG